MSFEDRVIELLESILEIVSEGQFKPMSEQVETETTPSWRQSLREQNIDVGVLDWTQDESEIMPKQWLHDLWGPINETLRSFGYVWVKDGKESHWSASGQPRQQTERPPKYDAHTIKDPNEPASEKQLNYIRTLGGTPRPNLTKGEASKVIQNLLNYGDKTPRRQ